MARLKRTINAGSTFCGAQGSGPLTGLCSLEAQAVAKKLKAARAADRKLTDEEDMELEHYSKRYPDLFVDPT